MAWRLISDQAIPLAKALGRETPLTREIEEVRRLLSKTARRDKRKQLGTFELLNNPYLLGYDS